MCMSVGFIFAFLIYLVILVGAYLLFKLWVPAILSKLGEPGGLAAQSINIIMWVVLMVFVLYLLWDLVSCLTGPGGLRMPRLSGR